jgi:Flp pilus assembly protein TadG
MNRRSRIRLRADRRATTAVEFALVCAPFTIFLLAVLSVALHFYLQQVLDYATQTAVRQVQLGHLSAGYTEADFVNKVLCPVFGGFQVCANLYVDLRPVTDYEQLTTPGVSDAPTSTATTGLVFCTGTPGQLMYAHIVYLAPSIGGTLLGGTAGGYNAIVSNAAFANENPTGTAVVQANGC